MDMKSFKRFGGIMDQICADFKRLNDSSEKLLAFDVEYVILTGAQTEILEKTIPFGYNLISGLNIKKFDVSLYGD